MNTKLAFIKSERFAKKYMLASLLILLASTVYWSILGALIQSSNADQLIEPNLFSAGALHSAQFPSSHTFLIKWPLFWLLSLTDSNANWITAATVLLCLATVSGFAYLLWRIERRPLVYGTIILALASVLLLIPAVPYASALLPVNMAMLATRNIEYLFYIAGTYLVIKSSRFKSMDFAGGVILLGLLFASDKLFLNISLLASGLALIVYARAKSWKMVSLSAHWLMGSVFSSALALAILAIVNHSHLTHLVSQTTSVYSAVNSPRNFILGLIYGVLGAFTNMGANPAFDATIVRNIPRAAADRLMGFGGLSYLINAVLLAGGVAASFWTIKLSQRRNNRQNSNPFRLTLVLIWSSVAALFLFVLSNHYYAVDARYLAIVLFGMFSAISVWLSKKQLKASVLITVGILLATGMALSAVAVHENYISNTNALADISNRNQAAAQILGRHKVDVLVADYWRALPIKAANSSLHIMPLADCTTARTELTSKAWQLDLHSHSFAYLLSTDKGLTDFPHCSLKQVVRYYGKPNSSIVLAGSLNSPKEYLLFYEHGIDKPAAPVTNSSLSTITPITLSDLPHTYCSVPTIMNIVAHQDDDLLFINPQTLQEIKAGHCVRTIYVTAGDAGAGRYYWLDREQGSEAAYSVMTGLPNVWTTRVVKLGGGQFITVANPSGHNDISLIFMHLPDGNLHGEGFKTSGYQSLDKLDKGSIKTIGSVDAESSYSVEQLQNALDSFMHLYQPAQINTQSNLVSQPYPDHSDHMAVGRFTQRAYAKYEQEQFNDQVTIPLSFYVGYPVHGMPTNVSDGILQAKEKAFLSYADFDHGVCHSQATCGPNYTYGIYLRREYTNSY